MSRLSTDQKHSESNGILGKTSDKTAKKQKRKEMKKIKKQQETWKHKFQEAKTK